MITVKVHFINADSLDIQFNEEHLKKGVTQAAIITEVCDRLKKNGFITVNNMVIPMNNIKYLTVDMAEVDKKAKK